MFLEFPWTLSDNIAKESQTKPYIHQAPVVNGCVQKWKIEVHFSGFFSTGGYMVPWPWRDEGGNENSWDEVGMEGSVLLGTNSMVGRVVSHVF